MANDVLSVSVPMNNARFGRLLSGEEMAELERRQRHYDARERARVAGAPPPVLDYDGNPMTVMKAWDERKAAERAATVANLASGQGGQGDVDVQLGEKMNPLTTAAMFYAGVPATVGGATGLFATTGLTLGSMEGLGWLAENRPDAAKYANLGLVAASVPGILAAGSKKAAAGAKKVASAVNDAVSEPTPQKTALLKAMYDDWLSGHMNGEAPAPLPPEAPVSTLYQHPDLPRRPVRTTPYAEDLPAGRRSGIPAETLPVDQVNGLKAELHPKGPGKKAAPTDADIMDALYKQWTKKGPDGLYVPSEDAVMLKQMSPAEAKKHLHKLWKENKTFYDSGGGDVTPVDPSGPLPFDPAELLSQQPVPPPRPQIPQPSQAAHDSWFANLVKDFGQETAEQIEQTVNNRFFAQYMYGDDPAESLALARKYEALRAIYDKIAEPNEILLGGSSSIGSEGTILRNEIGHDLDFQAPIANASRRTDIGTPEATAAMVAALKNRANVENAPVIQKLRSLYPQLKDAKFRYATRKFQWWGDEKYQPDVFTVPIPEPTVTPTGEANLMVNVLLDGQKVDLMLTDSAMLPSKGNPRLGRAETALHWKAAYLQDAGKNGRPLTPGQKKHMADLARYQRYSEDNMRIDPRSRRTQFSPFDFPSNRLVDENGLPVVARMETYPGSGEYVPVMMNPRGRILTATDPNMLYTWYDPAHPQNNPRYSVPPAGPSDKPLVAIRGAERHIRAPYGGLTDGVRNNGFSTGEPAPGIGIYPANNPELIADEIIKGGRWSTYYDGKHKDMVFYPRSAVDPAVDSGHVLHAQDAYWSDPYSPYYDKNGHVTRALSEGTPEAIDAMGRNFGRETRVPPGQFTEIDNAYRNYLYEKNPGGHYNKPPGGENYDGYGEARHMGLTPDGLVIPGELIDTDPAKARALIIDAIKKNMFLLPAAGGAGAMLFGDDTQQDAKGGDTRADAKGGDAPGPETEASEPPVSEPAPQAQGGPRIVINPTTFKNKKDALCVAFNEGFRLWMEANDFQPQSEPTDRQRRFFSDTAYADDELQLRRTILARVATFDTSVKDPTDDQLSETAQFLDGVLESGWCKNEWEQDCVSRLSEAVKAAIGAEPVEPREAPLEPVQAEPLEPAGGEEAQALQSGGSTDDDEEEDKFALQNSGQSDKVDQAEEADLASREAEQAESAGMQPEVQEQAQEPAADQGAPTAQPTPPNAPQAGQGLLHDALTGNLVTPEQASKAKDGLFVDLGPADYGAGTLPGGGSIDNQVNEMHKQVLSVFGLNNATQSDDPASNKNGRAKLTLASPVDPDSPGSIAYKGTRPGGIENPIVSPDSPGSIAYKGTRPGGIENPIVSPDSPGSIAGPVLSYAPGSIESPVDDPRRKEERRKRRDRRRRGLL